jgi:hypothetical protein
VGGVSKELLQQEADRPARPSRAASRERPSDAPERPLASGPSRRDSRSARVPRITPGVAAEEELVRVMLHDRSQVDFLLERVGADDFLDADYREIFLALVSRGAAASVDDLALAAGPAAARRMESLLGEPVPGTGAGRIVDDSLRTLACRKIQQRSTEIDALRQQGRGDGDALFIEKQQLALRAKELRCHRQFWK